MIDSLLKEGRGIGTIPDVPPIGTTLLQIRPEVLKAMALSKPMAAIRRTESACAHHRGCSTTQPKEPEMAQ